MSFLDGLYPVFTSSSPRPIRKNRPNNNQIYAKPFPLDVYPLPPLIPHNPLSLLHIAAVFVFQVLSQASSHSHPRFRGYYSPTTNSVHVTDPTSITQLWQNGFFGKGSLSRSEPSWLHREKKRLGVLAAGTSEEHTASRREERRKFKNERARKEREVIDERLMEELLVDNIAASHAPLGPMASTVNGEEKHKPGKPTLRSKYEGLAEAALLSPTKGVGFFRGVRTLPTPPETPSLNSTLKASENLEPTEYFAKGDVERSIQPPKTEPAPEIKSEEHLQPTEPEPTPEIKSEEHLQLTPEEAFFLTYALGILEVYPSPTLPPSPTTCTPLPTPKLLTHLLSTHPPSPADPFLLAYTTYHHFRALGWVVRPGLKFGCDYLLYLRGPVFSHAEFAVVIQPSYTHPFWKTVEGRALRYHTTRRQRSSTEEAEPAAEGGGGGAPSADDHERLVEQEERKRSWHWLHCLQRVQTQVRKTLVVAWVDIPPPPVPLQLSPQHKSSSTENEALDIDISALLQRYKVREMVIKRWIPNRSRD